MSEYMIDGALLTSIAEEVRNVDGSSSTLTPVQMVGKLAGVKSSIGAALLALTGNHASTLSVNVGDGQYYHYRAKMTDVDGRAAYSDPSMLTVAGYVAITKQPQDVVAAVGTKITHSVIAVGDGLTYQWQYSNDKGATWVNCSQQGYNTANFAFTALSDYNGWKHRCVITNSSGNIATSNEVTSTIGAIGITKQPVDVTAAVGDTVRLTVEAVGNGLTYQWQTKLTATSSWLNTGLDGAKTNTLTFSPTDAYDGRKYRCVITDSSGNTVTTNEVTLSLASNVAITIQPVSVEANVGDTVTFTVEADNVAVYQWQVSADSGTTWRDIPLADSKYSVNSGSTVHNLAGLIAAIEVGVSAPGFAKAATGTVTTSTTRLRILEITHGLGAAPDFAVLYVETSVFDKRGVMGAIIFKLSDGYDLYINAGKNSSGTRGVYFSSKGSLTNTNLNETKVTFTSDLIMSGSNSNTKESFDTHTTYRWIVGVYA